MDDKALREHVLNLLSGKGAHADFSEAVKDVPEKLRGVKPEGAPYSAWQLLEHIRIAQWDILEFCAMPSTNLRVGRAATGPKARSRPAQPPGTKAWQQWSTTATR